MIIPPAPKNRIAGVYPGLPRLAATSPDQRAGRHENGILNLIRGPLNLALLGLVVIGDQGHLTVTAVPGRQTAVPGAGNLPGQLPGSAASLRHSGGPVNEISATLTSILA